MPSNYVQKVAIVHELGDCGHEIHRGDVIGVSPPVGRWGGRPLKCCEDCWHKKLAEGRVREREALC